MDIWLVLRDPGTSAKYNLQKLHWFRKECETAILNSRDCGEPLAAAGGRILEQWDESHITNHER